MSVLIRVANLYIDIFGCLSIDSDTKKSKLLKITSQENSAIIYNFIVYNLIVSPYFLK